MTRGALLWAAMLAFAGADAVAQRPTTEIDTTAGYATQGISILASQVRVFGETRSGWRYYVEGAGALRSGADGDAFAAAYEYDHPFDAVEAYLERQGRVGGAIGGIRVGRYRAPFGIYGRSDHAYGGFLRPPFVRYGYYHGLSNYWLEGGVDLLLGTPSLQIEASLGAPQESLTSRRGGLDTVLRLQGHGGPLILGLSAMKTQPAHDYSSVRGRSVFTGLDVRWMREGVQLRGEWIHGRNFDRARMRGWYVDALVHRRGLGAVTPVARYERYKFDMPGDHDSWNRLTAGVKVQLTPSLTGHLHLIRPSGGDDAGRSSVDIGLTHTRRF